MHHWHRCDLHWTKDYLDCFCGFYVPTTQVPLTCPPQGLPQPLAKMFRVKFLITQSMRSSSASPISRIPPPLYSDTSFSPDQYKKAFPAFNIIPSFYLHQLPILTPCQHNAFSGSTIYISDPTYLTASTSSAYFHLQNPFPECILCKCLSMFFFTYFRLFPLFQECDAANVSSVLASDGVLTIRATKLALNSGERVIPITQETSSANVWVVHTLWLLETGEEEKPNKKKNRAKRKT